MNKPGKFIVHLLLFLLSAVLSAQSVILSPLEDSSTDINHIAVSALGKRNTVATLFVNGEEVAQDTFRIDGIVEFVNIEVPDGPVELKITTIGTTGQSFSTERHIHVIGPVYQIVADEKDISLPADGRSTGAFRFHIQDEWGYVLNNTLIFSAQLDMGVLLNTDLDNSQVGTQIAVNNGVCEVNIQSPNEASRGVLALEVNGHKEQFPILFKTPSEPFMLLGTLNAALSYHGSGDQASDLSNIGLYDRNSRNLTDQALIGGRTAFYAKGGVKPGYRLTASFDSDRGYMDQLFADVDPDDPYPLYGDASTLLFDAQTRSKLYAKLEHDESHLLIGDFNTALTNNEFTAYNRTFNGLQADWHEGDHQMRGFASLTDREQNQEEILGQGISGFYYLSDGGITRFSEKIRLIVRDRYHSETILNTKEQTRFLDYDINYVDGTLMFKQAVPGVDANGNPVFIVVSYEHQSQSRESLVGGLRYQGLIGDDLEIGATLIAEDKGDMNYYLYGVDADLPISPWLSVNGELAESRDPVLLDSSTIARAFRGEIVFTPQTRTTFKGYYRSVDEAFKNNSQVGKSSEGGSEKFGLKGRYQLKKKGELQSEYYEQKSNSGTSQQTENRVFTTQYLLGKMDGNGLKLGYENSERKKATSVIDSLSTYQAHSLYGGINLKLHDKLTGSLEHQQNLSSDAMAKPSNTSLGLSYMLAERLSLYWKYRLVPGAEYEHQNIVGLDSKISENTQITGRYEINGISSEARNRASIGLNNKWQINDDLSLNIAFESTAIIDSFEIVTPDHRSLALAGEYLPEAPWKLAGKYEQRKDKMSLSRVSSLGGDVRLFAGFGLISKFEHFNNSYKGDDAGTLIRTSFQAGLAYRPEENDVVNVLAKLAYIAEDNTHSTPTLRQDRLIASIHTYWQAFDCLGLSGRIAQRTIYDEEGDLFSDTTRTLFVSLRPEIAWNLKWSTAMDIRYMSMSPLDQNSTGLALEVDYLLKTNTQVGVGYIFSNFEDRDFSFHDYQFHDFYISIHLKFSEDIFNWH
ncbi:MAG: hypothetical protein K9N35_10735 [Candidatus Marinimicrobia bacterium]|nr:hypothetical protein [Candidatus Neomarinimicrobiota bacterium]